MSAICLRYRRGDAGESQQLHAEVARRIEQSGRFWISTTELKGRTWFRINPVNFRTRLEHMDELLSLLQRECELATQMNQGDKAPGDTIARQVRTPEDKIASDRTRTVRWRHAVLK